MMKFGMKTAGMMLAASLTAASVNANDQATFMMVPVTPGDTEPMVAYVPASGTELANYVAELRAGYINVCGQAQVNIGATTAPDGTIDDVIVSGYAINHGPFQHKINTLYKRAALDTTITIERMINTGTGYNEATGKWDRPICIGPVKSERIYRRYDYMYFTCEFEDTHTIKVDAEHNWQPYCKEISQ